MNRRGRKSSVRYYASKNGYFTHFEGKNIRLADGPDDAPKGKTYLAALARFQELMQVSHADTADQGNTVRVVVDLYGQHLERNGQDRSLIERHYGHIMVDKDRVRSIMTSVMGGRWSAAEEAKPALNAG